ncbi:RNA-binding protein 4.1-like [Gouania willdenowi]|uniref:RNA-binding protein 4.1-like n=1 Tax=Gouania willdenowi TaxID=441366 RepID=A0A8C5NEH8_GOUWI|nr:RNA-binding protein 4.1-like [Gouania willdenowi]XP_028330370.1 RNA-binding protein 4.1-like [Gouania willdenowi]
MVKIFVGNLASNTTAEELRQLFEKHGKVTECDFVKNYGFVHMAELAEAEEAVKNLNQHKLNGLCMKVELSKGKTKASTKLHIRNLGEGVTREMLQAKFEEFGPVVECDLVKDYAFVHMSRVEDAMKAISKLANTVFEGKMMNVQLSTSQLRTAPGMGDHKGCYVCGNLGHWSSDCPKYRNGSGSYTGRDRRSDGPLRGPFRNASDGYRRTTPSSDYRPGPAYCRSPYSRRITPPPPPPPPPPRWMSSYSFELGDRYSSRAAGPRNESSSVYYYERSKVQNPYRSSFYLDQGNGCPITPPPPPHSRPSFSSHYVRQPLPPSSGAAKAYYAGEHSMHTREPIDPKDYAYERHRLSPPPPSSRRSYAFPQSNSHYAPRYAPY